MDLRFQKTSPVLHLPCKGKLVGPRCEKVLRKANFTKVRWPPPDPPRRNLLPVGKRAPLEHRLDRGRPPLHVPQQLAQSQGLAGRLWGPTQQKTTTLECTKTLHSPHCAQKSAPSHPPPLLKGRLERAKMTCSDPRQAAGGGGLHIRAVKR